MMGKEVWSYEEALCDTQVQCHDEVGREWVCVWYRWFSVLARLSGITPPSFVCLLGGSHPEIVGAGARLGLLILMPVGCGGLQRRGSSWFCCQNCVTVELSEKTVRVIAIGALSSCRGPSVFCVVPA